MLCDLRTQGRCRTVVVATETLDSTTYSVEMEYHFRSGPMGLHSFSTMLLPHVALAFVDVISHIFAFIVLVSPLHFPACCLPRWLISSCLLCSQFDVKLLQSSNWKGLQVERTSLENK